MYFGNKFGFDQSPVPFHNQIDGQITGGVSSKFSTNISLMGPSKEHGGISTGTIGDIG
jgi:hypothetical protein